MVLAGLCEPVGFGMVEEGQRHVEGFISHSLENRSTLLGLILRPTM